MILDAIRSGSIVVLIDLLRGIVSGELVVLGIRFAVHVVEAESHVIRLGFTPRHDVISAPTTSSVTSVTSPLP